MTVRELIVALLDTPLDAYVEIEVASEAMDYTETVTGVRRVEHTGAGYGKAYVTLESERQ